MENYKSPLWFREQLKTLRLGAEVTEALNDYGLPILGTRITQRVSYPSTAANGTTVLDDDPKGDAANEIRLLIEEIKQKLN
jgi:chromosome partitioning protein